MSYNDQKILEGYLFWDHLGDAIIAAFEVARHGHPLLPGTRISDLASMHPNIRIDLFMVASDQRREKAACEIHRPAFARQKPPLPQDLPPPPPIPSCGGGIEQIGKRNSLPEAGGRLPDHGRSCQPDCCCSYRARQL